MYPSIQYPLAYHFCKVIPLPHSQTKKGWIKMYYIPFNNQFQYPNYVMLPTNIYAHEPNYWGQNMEQNTNQYDPFRSMKETRNNSMTDHGPNPFVININDATKQNNTFRTALWTGKHLQVTLMSLNVGEDIGLEIHRDVDQFLRVEQGRGIVRMGRRRDNLSFERRIDDDSAIFVPAGTWHNIINTGNNKLKLYSIYAPPEHPSGTVHVTKRDAMAAEEESMQRSNEFYY